ncbi:MAG: efflux RND transporter periplasmic adaptor subunit [Candidatus Moraniibacteriota bacterium]
METTQEETGRVSTKKGLLILSVIGFVVAGIVTGMYVFLTNNRLYVEKSRITAPMVGLSPKNGGKLEKLLVNSGDTVVGNQVVAQVGDELVKTKDGGIVIATENEIGKTVVPGEAVVTIVKPDDLRVVAQVEEDKGLSAIKVGQRASFTVDAFGTKTFDGIVDEVSPTSRASDVVFNISSQRQINEFDVKIRFDTAKYPELKNGMSAKSFIYTE